MGTGFEIPIHFAVDAPKGPMKEFFDAIKHGAEESGAAFAKVDVSVLADGFATARSEITGSLEQTKLAAAALVAGGQAGSESYSLAIAKVKELAEEESNLAAIMKRVAADSEIKPKGVDGLAHSFQAAQNELSQLVGTQRLALAQLELTGQKGTQEYEDLRQSIKHAENELGDMEEAMKRAGGALEPGFLEKMFQFEALEKAGEFLGQIAERGAELRKEMKNLSASTGLMGEDLQRVGDAGREAFIHGIGESSAEAVKTMGIAQQQLGKLLDPKGIDDFVLRAGGIGKVFDADVNEVIAKGRTFIQQFGTDGKEAGDLLALAMQQGANATGDTLDTIDEYSQHLKLAGFNAQEMVGILTRGVQQGARDTDKLGDAIKETGIRLKAGDISTALGDISSPITEMIQGIVAAGEAGELSIKEVLQKTAAATEEAFAGGQISDKIRSQLQVAVSGTPAEDIGSDLYGRIFAAPIDTAAVSEQAAKAGKSMVDAIEPNFIGRLSKTFSELGDKAASIFAPMAAGAAKAIGVVGQVGPALNFLKDSGLGSGLLKNLSSMTGSLGGLPSLAGKVGPALGSAFTIATGPIGIVIGLVAVLTAALAYYFSSTDDGQKAWASIKQSVSDFYDLAKPVLRDIGGIFLTVGKLIYSVFIAQFKIAWAVISAGFDLIGSLVGSLFGAAKGGDFLAEAFGSLDDVLANLKGSIDGALAAFQAFKEGLIDIIHKIGDLDFSGAAESAANLGKKAADAYTNGFKDSVAEHAAQKIQDGLDTALTGKGDLDIKVKANLDIVADLGKLEEAKKRVEEINDKITNAKANGDTGAVAQLTKDLGAAQDVASNLAERISKEVPAAAAGFKPISDGAGGYKKVFEVNAVAAEKFAVANQTAYGSKAQQLTQDYSKNLQSLAGDLNNQIVEQEELAATINKGGATKEQIARFDELNTKVGQGREGMLKAFTDGARAGLLTDDAIKTIAKSLKISEADARKLAEQQKKIAEETAKAGKSTSELAADFDSFQKAADDGYKKATAALAELIRTGQAGSEQFKKLQEDQAKFYQQKQEGASAANSADIDWQREQRKTAAETALAKYKVDQALRIQKIAGDKEQAEAQAKFDTEVRRREIGISLQYDKLEEAQKRQLRAELAGLRKSLAGELGQIEAEAQVAELTRLQANQKSEREGLSRHLQQEYDLLVRSGDRTESAIKKQYDTQLVLQQAGNDAAIRDLIERSTQFGEAQKEIIGRLGAGSIKADAALIEIDKLRDRLRPELEKTSKELQALIAGQALGMADLTTKGLDAIAEARIAEMPNQIEREAAARQLAAKRAFDVEIRAAGTNERLKSEARVRYSNLLWQSEFDAEIDREVDLGKRTRLVRINEARKTYEASLTAAKGNHALELEALRVFEAAKLEIERSGVVEAEKQAVVEVTSITTLFKDLYKSLDLTRRGDLLNQRATLRQQTADLDIALDQQAVSLNDFFSQSDTLRQQSHDLSIALGDDEADFWEKLRADSIAAFASLATNAANAAISAADALQTAALSREDQVNALKLAKIKEGIDASTALKQAELAIDEDIGGKRTALFANTALAIGATLTEMTLTGGKNIGDFTKVVLNGALDALQAMVPIWSAMILGEEVAKLGPLGIVEWIGLMILLEGAVAAARFGVNQLAEGGLVRGGRQLIQVNDDQWNRPEFVMSGGPTAQYLPQFEAINKGADPHTVFNGGPSEWMVDAMGELRRDVSAGFVALHGHIMRHEGDISDVRAHIDIDGALRYGKDLSLVYANDDVIAASRETTGAVQALHAEVRELKEIITSRHTAEDQHVAVARRIAEASHGQLKEANDRLGTQPNSSLHDLLYQLIEEFQRTPRGGPR